jgi:hypothetical protein
MAGAWLVRWLLVFFLVLLIIFFFDKKKMFCVCAAPRPWLGVAFGLWELDFDFHTELFQQ